MKLLRHSIGVSPCVPSPRVMANVDGHRGPAGAMDAGKGGVDGHQIVPTAQPTYRPPRELDVPRFARLVVHQQISTLGPNLFS